MGKWLVAVWLMLAGALGAPAWAQQKIALVVGISDYAKGGKLEQALVDAGMISAALTDVGFSTETLVKRDLSKSDLDDALLAFSVKAARADVAVLYFAGHGMQHGGDNWLVPASAQLLAEAHIRREGVPLSDVMALLRPARFRIVIVDACRDNPFAAQKRTSGNGLGQLDHAAIPTGSMVAYSTAAGNTAPNDGVYAATWAKYIRADGLSLEQIKRRVTSDVMDDRRRKLIPEAEPYFEESYTGTFSFRGGYREETVAPGPASAAQSRIAELERRLAELEQRPQIGAAPASATPSTLDLSAMGKSGGDGATISNASPGIDPCAAARADWAAVENSKSAEVARAYLNRTSQVTCSIWYAKAQDRIQTLVAAEVASEKQQRISALFVQASRFFEGSWRASVTSSARACHSSAARDAYVEVEGTHVRVEVEGKAVAEADVLEINGDQVEFSNFSLRSIIPNVLGTKHNVWKYLYKC